MKKFKKKKKKKLKKNYFETILGTFYLAQIWAKMNFPGKKSFASF